MPLEVETPHGPARVHLRDAPGARALLALGHGAGGSLATRDLEVVSEVAVALGLAVALVEQPYRVAGRRSPAPARQLDRAWIAVLAQLRERLGPAPPLVVGGRSSGARVACRTAAATRAAGVLCLAFPLHPPGRPEKTRLDELAAVDLPVLVVQGTSDPFGMPPAGDGRQVVRVPGNHGLTAGLDDVAAAAGRWLETLLRRQAPA